MIHFPSITIVFLLCVTFSYATKIVDVEIICKEAEDPSFCSTFLKSRPPGISGDLVSLDKYSIEYVHANITYTVDLIKKLNAQSRDINEEDYYRRCLTHFDWVVYYIVEIEEKTKRGDYTDVHEKADFITIDINNCIYGDSPSEPVFHDTSSLPKYLDVIKKIANIISNKNGKPRF
ncbi:putative pectinesterase inhibitor domain-containing protein [Medicago truncatula]|uniref:Putative pectinesterase inhibitor domain-containing protein n=1 Tax=Medicago truncatula TaxID=3880 RepID=A0A396HBQ8_MEDTR|nr:putative pectinesterase inhibitor domain-containing protein [Medicago truncatula]